MVKNAVHGSSDLHFLIGWNSVPWVPLVSVKLVKIEVAMLHFAVKATLQPRLHLAVMPFRQTLVDASNALSPASKSVSPVMCCMGFMSSL